MTSTPHSDDELMPIVCRLVEVSKVYRELYVLVALRNPSIFEDVLPYEHLLSVSDGLLKDFYELNRSGGHAEQFPTREGSDGRFA